MWISDTSVRRPVGAIVLSLLLIAFGLLAFDRLSLREYPDIDPPIVSVSTDYAGAAAAVIERRITQLIEDRLAGLEGVRTMTSNSQDGHSSVTIEFELDRDIEAATNDVRDRISGILDSLPEEADPPEVRKVDADDRVILWLNLVSEQHSILELTDYASRYLEDRFASIDGVARVRVSGGMNYAMRVWLDRRALAARGLTVGDVEAALRRENVELPAGSIQSEQRDFSVRVMRSYLSEEDFQQLVITRGDDGYLVRLKDVARVAVEADETRRLFRGNTIPMVGLGIIQQSTANTLEVARLVKAESARIAPNLPEGMQLLPSFDSSAFVENAVHEVYSTLFIAAVLVVLVIFLFLGDWRAMLVPALTLPVSIIATFIVLYFLDYSLNLLTLLALVLAIGLVVDDAIVVLENIHRRVHAGEPPLLAAYRGTRQVGFAVIATTAVLVAVFLPITFLEGNVGRLFGEFSVAMCAAVIFSSVVALTLSPVVCSKLLRPLNGNSRIARQVDARLDWLQRNYRTTLHQASAQPWIMVLIFVLLSGLAVQLFRELPREFTPKEDRGVLFLILSAPQGSSFEYTQHYLKEVEDRLMPLVEEGQIKRLLMRAPLDFSGVSFDRGAGILVLEDWGQRRNGFELIGEIQKRISDVRGVRAFAVMPQALGGRNSKPVQLVLGGANYEELARWRDRLLAAVSDYPGLSALDSDYQERAPQLRVSIHREQAADLGISVQEISRTLETLLGSRRVTTFDYEGEEYDVILEAERDDKATPLDIQNLHVRSAAGDLIPLAQLVTLEERAEAASLNRYNRMRAITIEANVNPGYTLGEVLTHLVDTANRELPSEAVLDFKGESLNYMDSNAAIVLTFALALLVVFLVLAAQFESFRQPMVIMLTVPLATTGALLGLLITGQSLNIYSEIGIIMLIGLATKNGILLVEFTNQLRDQGVAFEEAIEKAAALRLRPILMTAFTTAAGAVPLMLASGAGSETRQVIGVVVLAGVCVATLFTLYIVPIAYRLMARGTGSPEQVSRELDQLDQQLPDRH